MQLPDPELCPDEKGMYRPLPDRPDFRCNLAGLRWLMAHDPANYESPTDCEWSGWFEGDPFPCVFGGGGPCVRRSHARDSDFVDIYRIDYQRVLIPVGQMSLFAPRVTHRVVWEHWRTGERIEARTLPMTYIMPACKHIASRLLRQKWAALQAAQGKKPYGYRVRTRGKTKKAQAQNTAWLLRQTERMHDLPGCVFDPLAI